MIYRFSTSQNISTYPHSLNDIKYRIVTTLILSRPQDPQVSVFIYLAQTETKSHCQHSNHLSSLLEALGSGSCIPVKGILL